MERALRLEHPGTASLILVNVTDPLAPDRLSDAGAFALNLNDTSKWIAHRSARNCFSFDLGHLCGDEFQSVFAMSTHRRVYDSQNQRREPVERVALFFKVLVVVTNAADAGHNTT
jgi:hypothetical protein